MVTVQCCFRDKPANVQSRAHFPGADRPCTPWPRRRQTREVDAVGEQAGQGQGRGGGSVFAEAVLAIGLLDAYQQPRLYGPAAPRRTNTTIRDLAGLILW